MVYEWNSRLSKGELMPEGALTSFTVCDTYLYFVGQLYCIYLRNKVGHA